MSLQASSKRSDCDWRSATMSVTVDLSAHVMSQYMLSVMRTCEESDDNPQRRKICNGLERDRSEYCQRLAEAVIQVSSRTTQGKMVNCQLEVFLYACALHNDSKDFPASTEELNILPESTIREILIEMFTIAVDTVFPVEPIPGGSLPRDISPPFSSPSNIVPSSTSSVASSSNAQPSSSSRKKRRGSSVCSDIPEDELAVRKSSRISTAMEIHQMELLKPFHQERLQKEQFDALQALAQSTQGIHVYLVAVPRDQHDRLPRLCKSPDTNGRYIIPNKDMERLPRSKASVVLTHIAQTAQLKYRYMCKLPAGRKVSDSVGDLVCCLFDYEAMNLLSAKPVPTTLKGLISLSTSNYAAMRALTLAGDTGDKVPIKPNSSNSPPHCFYFFSNPMEYFITLARNVVQTILWIEHQLKTMKGGNGVENRGMLEGKLRDMTQVLQILDNMTCDVTAAIAEEIELHKPYSKTPRYFREFVDEEDMLNHTIISREFGDLSTIRIGLPNNGSIRPLVVDDKEYDLLSELFRGKTTLAKLNKSCKKIFADYPSWDYPSFLLVAAEKI